MTTQVRPEEREAGADSRPQQRPEVPLGQQRQQGQPERDGKERQPGPLPQGMFAGYADEHRPLLSYAAFVALFNALFAWFLLVTRRGDRRLPDHFGIGDLLLLTVATHKLSRLLAKDWVTSFLRAPFVRYKRSSRPGEVEEEPRGAGLRLALGELLTCPFCLGQ